MTILFLSIWGLCLGSFVNAFVWRIYLRDNISGSTTTKNKKGLVKDYSILHGRSMCVYCEHTLSWKDLIPIISWLSLGGKCRYCKSNISLQYPVVEITTAALFIISYYAWPIQITQNTLNIAFFMSWLILLIGYIALIIFDIRWMILPNRIIYPLIVFALSLFFIDFFNSLELVKLLNLLLSIFVSSGIFMLIFQISNGKWIGGGDVKLGFLIGATLADPYKSFMVIVLASFLGTVFIIPGLLLNKISRDSKIPFGPFLIVATIIVNLFGSLIIDWYKSYILLIS